MRLVWIGLDRVSLDRIGLDRVTSGYFWRSLSDLKSEELQGRKRGEGEQRGKLVAWIGLFYDYCYHDYYDVDYDYHDVDNYYGVDNSDQYDVDHYAYMMLIIMIHYDASYDVDNYDSYDVDVDDEFA